MCLHVLRSGGVKGLVHRVGYSDDRGVARESSISDGDRGNVMTYFEANGSPKRETGL